jgi:integral membrane sensor domain MASE1
MRRSQGAAARGTTLAYRQPRYWLAVAGISAAYIASAKLGLGLSVAQGVITPVWAPSGIALAALFLFGRRFWPAVAVGALVANATSGADVGLGVSLAIAFGNTLEALTGAFLLRRAGFDASLERVRDVLALVGGAGVATMVSATNGVLVLFLTGNAHGALGSDWLLWWFGDAAGILLVSPLLFVLAASRWKRPSLGRLAEAAPASPRLLRSAHSSSSPVPGATPT